MDRRWIRIDRAHQLFDCPPGEFATVLTAAQLESGFSEMDTQFVRNSDSKDRKLIVDDFQLLEAINAELALLANLQRRERILRADREQSEHEFEKAEHGKLLADLHAATLGQAWAVKNLML